MKSTIIDFLNTYKDSFIGAGLYFLYGVLMLDKPLVKSSFGFLMGSCLSIYAAPVLVNMTNLNISFVSFSTGFLGMKITEALLDIDFKQLITDKLSVTNKEKPNESEQQF